VLCVKSEVATLATLVHRGPSSCTDSALEERCSVPKHNGGRSLPAGSRAADMAGAAATFHDHQKKTAYARVEPNGYGFVPFSVETYGQLGQPAMKLLHQLGDEVQCHGLRLCRALCASLAWVWLGVISGCTVRRRACFLEIVAVALGRASASLPTTAWWRSLLLFVRV
jgi:hypothetical protein